MAEKSGVRKNAYSSDHELSSDFVEGPKWKGSNALKKDAKDQPIRKIKVTKLPDGAVEETLMNYFENMQHNGGGPIENIEYHPATSSAIIEFQKADAVDRVLKKRPLLFLKRQISVEEYVEKVEEEVEGPSSHTVEVHGFVENTSEDVLEMYFENSKRSGGSEVTSVVIEGDVALVTFTDKNVASSVCEREHKLSGRLLSVSLHLPKKKSSAMETEIKESEDPVCTVEVRGYKLGSEGTIELYFENTKRSGGDEIVNFDPITSDGVIFITFASEEVAKRVSERQHIIAGCTLDVKLCEPPKRKSTRKWSKICSKQPVPHCVIAVRGVTSRIIEAVSLYFENKRRSGGDEIVKFEYKEENGIAYITYESEEVARRVVTHGQHKLEGQPLKVKLFIPPEPRPHYEDRVLFVRLTSKITRDGLTNFLEAKIGLTPADFFFGEKGDKVIIRFNEKIDFEKLEEACKKRPLEGIYLVPSKVYVSNSIIISNLKITTTEDMIESYFENEKRSWGGPMEKIEFKREEEYCLVFFEDHTICDRVLQRKHKIDGSELQVSIYYESLGHSEYDNGPSFKLPKPLKLEGLEFAKIQFLMKSEPNRIAIEKQLLQDCFTQIQWPQTETDFTTLTCTLTSDVQDCKKKALIWAKQAEQNLHDFLKVISVHNLSVFQEIFEQVLQNLQNLVISVPDGVALFVKNAESFQVVGHKAVATGVLKDIGDIIKKAEADFDRRKEQTKETLTTLKYDQFRLLLAQKYPITTGKHTETEGPSSASVTVDAADDCVICMCPMTNPRTLPCGHSFCAGCVDQLFKHKPVCPVCGKIVGILTGDQPEDGRMDVKTSSLQLAGYEGSGSISITYTFPAGKQGPIHPSPGCWYCGLIRNAYLPDTHEGRTVCRMLQLAFERRLVFTISQSRTTGKEGLTWNGIHHKTSRNPRTQFGYPDPDYLSRVKKELASKGITEADLPPEGTGSFRYST